MNNKFFVLIMVILLFACSRSEDVPVAESGKPELDEQEIVAEPDYAEDPTDSMVKSWIVEVEGDLSAEDAASAAIVVIPQISASEPLFPDSPEFSGMYILSTDDFQNEWAAREIAYELKDLPQFTDAVPNYANHQADLPRAAPAACMWGAGDVDVPTQHGWSLIDMHVYEAWDLPPPAGGKSQGEGVTICHPDSGWTDHVELDSEALDLAHALDLVDVGSNAKDPLNYSGNPGHGSATGSVLISRGGLTANGETVPANTVTGVAPKATLIPIRTVKSVAQFLDSNLARAVNYARSQNCDVVSMSIGGAGFFGLKKAIRKAVEEDDKIVVSASGNCVGFVVAPAKYESTIAAAASNAENKPWKGSSKGAAITMTAPGEGIWIARRERNSSENTKVEAGNGTSFATTAIAAAAADWIAFHGKARLNAAKGNHSLSALFRFCLAKAFDAPSGWNANQYGPGILNVLRLLEVDIDTFPKDQPRSLAEGDTALMTLANTIDRSPAQTRAVLQHLFGNDNPERLADLYGAELERIAVIQPTVIQTILDQVDQRAPRTAIDNSITDSFSNRMQAATTQIINGSE